MSDAAIRAAIESRIGAWAAAQTPAIPVAWQNASFTPPTSRYLRGFLMPADNDSRYMEGGDALRVGMYQIDVCVPPNTGPAAAEAIVAALEALFPTWLRLDAGNEDVVITRTVTPKPGAPQGTHYVVSCRLRYRLYST